MYNFNTGLSTEVIYIIVERMWSFVISFCISQTALKILGLCVKFV